MRNSVSPKACFSISQAALVRFSPDGFGLTQTARYSHFALGRDGKAADAAADFCYVFERPVVGKPAEQNNVFDPPAWPDASRCMLMEITPL